MGILADRNGDIRLSNTVVECKSVKAGSILSFGIDDDTGRMLRKQMIGLGNTHIVVCMVIDAAQLDAVEKEISNELGNTPDDVYPIHKDVC